MKLLQNCIKKIDTSISFVDKNNRDKLIYVLHFPKKRMLIFKTADPDIISYGILSE